MKITDLEASGIGRADNCPERGSVDSFKAPMHDCHFISGMNSPVEEYFPNPAAGGALDDEARFYELFEREPRASNSHITLSDAPGLGVTSREANVNAWRLNL